METVFRTNWVKLYALMPEFISARMRRVSSAVFWHASRPIDFIIYGVARSGTTALARALCEHPGAVCFNEVLKQYDTRLTLVNVDRKCLRHPQREEQQHLIHKAIYSSQPVLIGNKLPNYFLALRRITTRDKDIPIVLTYRSPEGFVGSWNARAQDPNDNWPRDMLGIFGIGDQILCLAAAIVDGLQTDILVVPHSAFASSREELLNTLAEYLGLEQFSSKSSEAPWTPRRATGFNAPEAHAMRLTNALEIDSLLSKDRAYAFSRIKTQLVEELKKIPHDFPEQLHKLAVDADALDNSKFAAKWLAERKPLWDRLVQEINPDLGRA